MRFERLADWLSWQEGLHPRPIDLGLDRCRMVASRVGIGAGDSVVITVTGTNGKGSCVAYLEAMSRAAGYSVGAYLSPPLEGLNESIRINGENASDEQLARAFDLVDRARGGVSLTAFEFRTLAALRLFAEMRPQLLLLEIGMGGARDAVNVLDSDIAVFTTLDVDHTGWLGPDRNSIAREKAGILRADRPAVCGDPDPPPSLLACAKSVRSPLRVAGRDFRYEIEGERWSWTGWANHHSNLPSPGIRGRCQYDNATTALAAIEHLPPALRPGTAEIRDGVATAALTGRQQLFDGDVTRVLDVAHNRQASTALRYTLNEMKPARRTLGVFGALEDKNVAALVDPMAVLVDGWYVGDVPDRRGLDGVAVAERLTKARVGTPISIHSNLESAYRSALADARSGDRIVAWGSFATARAALRVESAMAGRET